MNNGTTNDRPDDHNVTDVAAPDQTTTAPLPGDQAVLRVTRPEWMDPIVWARIKEDASAFFAEQVDQALRNQEPCTEHTWCSMRGDGPEHSEYHCGEPIELDGGWGAWLTETRMFGEVELVLEGTVDSVTMSAAAALAVLFAAESAPARASLIEMLSQAES